VLLVVAVVMINGIEGQNKTLPVVMWHGMGDTCCNPLSLGRIQKLIETHIPGIYVHSLRIGSNVEFDALNSFFMNSNRQVDYANKLITEDPKLAGGFNAIGFSQGSQFLRAYIQRHNTPRISRLISIGGQHQGVYGFPRCPGENFTLCDYARKLLTLGAYNPLVQDNLAQANYWKDPFKLDEYLKYSKFLSDINNELPNKNATYKANLKTLDALVLVKFTRDGMVQPIESEWFGTYKPGQDKEVLKLAETDLYKEDWLGLKELDSAKKISFLEVDGDHLQFPTQWFIDNVIPHLRAPSF